MEGSAKYFEKFFKEHPPDRTKGKLAALHYDFYPFEDEDVAWYEKQGCKMVKVCAEPGDLILWDSRQMHFAKFPETDMIRTIIYACYVPASMAQPEDLKKKKEIFERWEGQLLLLLVLTETGMLTWSRYYTLATYQHS